MRKEVFKSLLFLFGLLLFSAPAYAGEVNLSVAASLKDACNEIINNFLETHPGKRFFKNYGGSGALAKQIENGAPADLFISANPKWMEYLKDRNLLDPVNTGVFSYNTLVFVSASEKDVSSMEDLHRLERIAIGSPMSVPAGEYAMEAMKNAGADRQLEKKLVLAKDVRECLMYAEQGVVDGAFVYRTDALMAKKARIHFTVPPAMYPRVTYLMGLTAAGSRNPEAVEFFRYLGSDEAKSVLEKYGFAVR